MANVDSLVIEFLANDGFENIDFRFGVGFIRVVYAPIDFELYAGYGKSTPIRFVRAGERVDLCLPDLTDNISIAWGIAPAVPGAEYAKAILMISDSWLEASGASEQSIGLAVYDSLGQIRGWNPLASGDSVTNQQSNAASVYIQNASLTVDTVRRRTYDAVAKRTTRDYETGIAFAAAGRSVLFTLWNPGGITLTLVSVDVALIKVTAACQVWFDLMEITTQPSGGSTITPMPRLIDDTASAAEVKRAPGGGAAETGTPFDSIVYQLGITGADSTAAPAPPVLWQPLYEPKSAAYGESYIEIPSGRGVAVVVDCNAIATVRVTAKMTYWEV